jgi:hypothetical protein
MHVQIFACAIMQMSHIEITYIYSAVFVYTYTTCKLDNSKEQRNMVVLAFLKGKEKLLSNGKKFCRSRQVSDLTESSPAPGPKKTFLIHL